MLARARAPRRRWLRLPWLGVAALGSLGLTATCGGELPGARVCDADAPCGSSEACVLGRCRAPDVVPVGSGALRHSLPPVEVGRAVSTPTGQRVAEHGWVRLGDPREGTTLLLLRFELPALQARGIERAVLQLTPVAGCSSLPATLELALGTVLEPWSGEALAWERRPAMTLPMRAPRWPTVPERVLRLDVTGLVAEWLERPMRQHGLALLAGSTGPGFGCFASGQGQEDGPRLELYLRPKPAEDAGVDAGRDAGDAGRDAGAEREADGGAGEAVDETSQTQPDVIW